MPRGLPDYYNPDTLVSQRLANVEEVVTAIQGIANLDNRGRTLYFTHFAEGVNDWRLEKFGDGVAPVASINHAKIAPASLEIDAGTDSGSGYSYAQKFIRAYNLKSAGVEFSFSHYNDCPKILLQLDYDNGVELVRGTITIDQVGETIKIDDGGTDVFIVSLPDPKTIPQWMTAKLVIDFDTPAYVRLLLGLRQYDISEYELATFDTDATGLLRVWLYAEPLDDGTNVAYIGHVTITIDEP